MPDGRVVGAGATVGDIAKLVAMELVTEVVEAMGLGVGSRVSVGDSVYDDKGFADLDILRHVCS